MAATHAELHDEGSCAIDEDLLIIDSFAQAQEDQVARHQSRLVFVDEVNRQRECSINQRGECWDNAGFLLCDENPRAQPQGLPDMKRGRG